MAPFLTFGSLSSCHLVILSQMVIMTKSTINQLPNSKNENAPIKGQIIMRLIN
jgi:hypothetical protein